MYEQQILRILLDVGARGISTKKLAKHVYNHYSTLFYQPDFRDVYRYTQRYVQSHSRSPQSVLERAEKWGHYRLNTKNSAAARQLMLSFAADNKDADSEEGQELPAPDLSLSLFDEMG